MAFWFSTNKLVAVFVFGLLALNCFGGFGSNAQLLPEDEEQKMTTSERKLSKPNEASTSKNLKMKNKSKDKVEKKYNTEKIVDYNYIQSPSNWNPDKKINNHCKIDTIDTIRELLTETQLKMFRDGPFGNLFYWKLTTFPVKLTWQLIYKQCKHDDQSVFTFNFAGKEVIFDLQKFAQITGLNCKKNPPRKKGQAPKKTVIQNVFKKNSAKVSDIMWFFAKEQEQLRPKTSDADVVRLAHLYCITRFVVSNTEKMNISNEYISLVHDNELMNEHNWGKVSFDATLHSFRSAATSTADHGIALKGFPYAVIIWAFETLQFLKKDNFIICEDPAILPRMLKWHFLKIPNWSDMEPAFEFMQQEEVKDITISEEEEKQEYMTLLRNENIEDEREFGTQSQRAPGTHILMKFFKIQPHIH